jgi:C-terminal processing protease CtpA/Prc
VSWAVWNQPDGVPTIHNIKPASALAEQVQIGDRLLSVDGIDVSIMLASDVSRLIASRKEALVRKFIFVRPRKGTVSIDEDESR